MVRFVLLTLPRNIMHLAVITRKINIRLGILKGGTGKEPVALIWRSKRVTIVYAVVVDKFTQRKLLKSFHIALKGREIVEELLYG